MAKDCRDKRALRLALANMNVPLLCMPNLSERFSDVTSHSRDI